MAIDKRKTPDINAGSQADIAFLLLIFFLVATTMNTDTGIARVLPPMPPEDQQQEEIKVKDRNLFLVFINGRGDIMAGPISKQEPIALNQLKDIAKEFIVNPMDDENLPEKVNKEIELPEGGKWVYPVSEGFNEVRDEVATRKFGSKFAELSEEQRNAVSKAVPLKISEAEPRNIKK